MTSTPTFTEAEFRKASASNPDRECVRVARRDGWVEIRDDKTPFGSLDDRRLLFSAEDFDRFQTGVRAGALDGHCLEMIRRADGVHTFCSANRHTRIELEFTDAEVAAFLAGVRAGEFDIAVYAA